jgi:1-acyl-sn-glycerol-3-phosphate acyltransferase
MFSSLPLTATAVFVPMAGRKPAEIAMSTESTWYWTGTLAWPLVVVGAVVVAVAIMLAREYTRHWLIRCIVRLTLKVYCRLTTEGRHHVPREGPLIVAANHASWLDTLFLGAAVPRLIHYVAAKEFYDLWYLRWVMWLYGTIPIERGKGQRRPLARAAEALGRGRVIGMFPEGRMSTTGALQPLQGGVALLAAETGAPIVPVAIAGGYDVMGPHLLLPRPRKVRIRIGEPIDPQGLGRDEILSRIDAALRALLDNGPR